MQDKGTLHDREHFSGPRADTGIRKALPFVGVNILNSWEEGRNSTLASAMKVPQEFRERGGSWCRMTWAGLAEGKPWNSEGAQGLEFLAGGTRSKAEKGSTCGDSGGAALAEGTVPKGEPRP